MSIPEGQLETWSYQGAIVTAKNTHESIRNALDCFKWPDNVQYEAYLQGSYKNDTNIRDDMDVDLVVQLNSAFYSNLNEEQKRELGLVPAAYGWTDFRNDVLSALQTHYGTQAIAEGNSCLKLSDSGGRLPADVVVCAQYRMYRSVQIEDFVEGITFRRRDTNVWTVNYPKLHYGNGVKKHQDTNARFKPSVRMFKNLRDYIVEKGRVSSDFAPSYFIECLLYNVPDGSFSGGCQDTFCSAVNWLNSANLTSLICQNGQELLCGAAAGQWPEQDARQFLQQLATLWNGW